MQIFLEKGQHIEDVFPFALGKVTWELRSSYDPWLLSMVLTEDTKEFGMTENELRYIGIALLLC